MDINSVLDVGSGGVHSDTFKQHGKHVTTNNLYDADVIGDYLECDFVPHDLVWASHVLEHQPNPNLFLRKCFKDIKKGGYLAVTVPPLKHEIVGGHVSLWNEGLLIYHCILAGFDCSEAMVKKYGYNISLIVKKKPAILPKLNMDYGDIEKLAEFFPMKVEHGFNGEIGEVNWKK